MFTMIELPLNLKKWLNLLPYTIVALYKNDSTSQTESLFGKSLHELLVTNLRLWGYEDEARRTDLQDKDIVNLKRNIDINNQKRNDLMDAIDAILKEDIEKKIEKNTGKTLPLNSETPGSIFDRLTVLALRNHHLKKETERKDIDKSHIERCILMLNQVDERSQDLLKCLEELLLDYYAGRKKLKSYKQHKLYNDPKLNPSLRK